MSVFSPKRRKQDVDGVLSEPIGHYWQTLFDSGERADVLVCVKGESGGDIMLKVRRNGKRTAGVVPGLETGVKFYDLVPFIKGTAPNIFFTVELSLN